MKLLLAVFLVVLQVVFASDDGRCGVEDVKAGLVLIDKWIAALPFPDSTEVSQDLSDILLFDETNLEQAGGAYAHSKPPRIFTSKEKCDQLLADIAGLLRRGVRRFRKQLNTLVAGTKKSSLNFLMLKIRSVLNSFNDFYVQAKNAIALGPRQVETADEWAEYGPETNFWLKFRPYLSCSHAPRIGPEYGGIKTWCNPQWFQKEGNHPRTIMSGGSGGDFAFEDTVMKQFPNTKVVTLDCFMPPSTAYGDSSMPRDPARLIYVEKCLHGSRNEDKVVFPAGADVVTYPELSQFLQEKHKIEHFDLHKLNIEAFEYPTYGLMMRDADKHMAHTKMIFLEMHRHGMADWGLNWDSLLLSELLFATFYSGGFHAVSMEKWHDATSASDFVFVNQTWFLESEIDALESTWDDTFPMERAEHIDNTVRNFDWSVFSGFKPQERATPGLMEGVEFVNQLNDDIELLWLGADGQGHHAATIVAGHTANIDTYPGHRFKYRNLETNVLSDTLFEMARQQKQYVINM